MATKKSIFSIFNLKVSDRLLSQAVYVYQSNSHQDTSKVKTRGEINASKRKIYKQKGTGRARHGALSAPIFVGGGVVHGPTGVQPKRKKLNLKMKRIALAGALSILQAKKSLGLYKPPTGTTIKTKQVIAPIPKRFQNKPLILVQYLDSSKFLKAVSNIKLVQTISANQLNAYHVLKSKNLLFTPKAFEFIKNKLKKYL